MASTKKKQTVNLATALEGLDEKTTDFSWSSDRTCDSLAELYREFRRSVNWPGKHCGRTRFQRRAKLQE
jgi:hypothetical protein